MTSILVKKERCNTPRRMRVHTLTHFGSGKENVSADDHIQNRSNKIMSAVAAPFVCAETLEEKRSLRHDVDLSTLIVKEKYTLYNIILLNPIVR